MRIGITGNKGFIGRHLSNYLFLQDGVEIVSFDKSYFNSDKALQEFVNSCEVIYHLAAMNRHDDPHVIYNTNIELVEKLCKCLYNKTVKTKVIFSSSTQYDKENLYGRSKADGAKLLKKWSEETENVFLNCIIPNVFGPFGKPYYNSVVATFCYQTTHNLETTVKSDSPIELIYINELIEFFFTAIKKNNSADLIIKADHKTSVLQLANKLKYFRDVYLIGNEFPNLDTAFDLALFNTFRCYIDHDHYPVKFTEHTDNRGAFVEIVRANTSGQFSYSTTVPGITRGEHFHTRKAERFSVIKGKARISLRKIDSEEIIDYYLEGDSPSFVDMPIWHTHNITNIGDEELLCLFWINEPYNQSDPDTYFVKVREET